MLPRTSQRAWGWEWHWVTRVLVLGIAMGALALPTDTLAKHNPPNPHDYLTYRPLQDLHEWFGNLSEKERNQLMEAWELGTSGARRLVLKEEGLGAESDKNERTGLGKGLVRGRAYPDAHDENDKPDYGLGKLFKVLRRFRKAAKARKIRTEDHVFVVGTGAPREAHYMSQASLVYQASKQTGIPVEHFIYVDGDQEAELGRAGVLSVTDSENPHEMAQRTLMTVDLGGKSSDISLGRGSTAYPDGSIVVIGGVGTVLRHYYGREVSVGQIRELLARIAPMDKKVRKKYFRGIWREQQDGGQLTQDEYETLASRSRNGFVVNLASFLRILDHCGLEDSDKVYAETRGVRHGLAALFRRLALPKGFQWQPAPAEPNKKVDALVEKLRRGGVLVGAVREINLEPASDGKWSISNTLHFPGSELITRSLTIGKYWLRQAQADDGSLDVQRAQDMLEPHLSKIPQEVFAIDHRIYASLRPMGYDGPLTAGRVKAMASELQRKESVTSPVTVLAQALKLAKAEDVIHVLERPQESTRAQRSPSNKTLAASRR